MRCLTVFPSVFIVAYCSDEECMARIGRFPKNRKHFQKVSCFWGNIIIFVAINRKGNGQECFKVAHCVASVGDSV